MLNMLKSTSSHRHFCDENPKGPQRIRAARPLRAGDPAAMVLTSAPLWQQEIFSTSKRVGLECFGWSCAENWSYFFKALMVFFL